ncbi:MAG TPA: tRNA (adenosine(37)-N6)-threonylcarbamoyltransferase complex ATPase subunit type 1 TsaE [Sphaerochaeta sp.]|jgi:tRNA threonylcarbamoyladenosine biosynthesis protein TsaE|uniref:tRNA (adenosine(37)-N6)-threonylcarbamoyltransferase complex ATPase subunit type 1 TsaE n=1 Tax=Sphaerochaeta sp. UBA5836 TaxID=1947474 RepID=UPI000EBCA188|nr:tRNA (adenosine(37)-N6)-threonylcarbamoyltransferase complex ATPase subunit type 1 TsaE [Sphaerochaeta sp. UBA5836]HCU29821.1 tRNA (adenosine(37)-N6)-threonylcarbamoyltransferase complex ATPase subunit type 1 TsaE [Sphaerochaeta sp.]
MTYISHSEEETLSFGYRLGKQCKSGTVISLRGSLGAGKTVLAKGLARALGITEPIVSPTFTLIQQYEGTLPLYHMDLYRIDSAEEFEMIGGEELLYSNGVAIVEWSEKIAEMLPDTTLFVDIDIMPNEDRVITLQGADI